MQVYSVSAVYLYVLNLNKTSESDSSRVRVQLDYRDSQNNSVYMSERDSIEISFNDFNKDNIESISTGF